MGEINNNPIPRSPRTAVLAFGVSHKPIFVANAAAIGILPADATKFGNAVDALQTAMEEQETIKNAYRSATTNVDKKLTTLLEVQGDVVRKIRAFAGAAADPNAVLLLAQIPPVQSPTTMDPPGQPTNLTVTLDTTNGWINLKWKCENPEGASGTSYIIKRRLPGEATFSFVGVSGNKKFTDTTFFAGPDSVEYTVTGQRANLTGPASAIYKINFGQAPGGGLTAWVGTSGEGKAAA